MDRRLRRVRLVPTLVSISVFAFASFLPTPRSSEAATGFYFEKAMLSGEAAPGTEAGTVFGPSAAIFVTTVPRLSGDGRVVFTGQLEGPAVTPQTRDGIWSGDPMATSLIARSGAPADDVPAGIVYAAFPSPYALVSPPIGGGRFGFAATLTGSDVSAENDEGVWVHEGGSSLLLAREGEQAAGLASGIVVRGLLSIDVNRDGHAFVTSMLSGSGVTTANDECFWTDRTGALVPILREGDQAPGLSSGVKFGGAGQFVGTGYSFESTTWSDASALAIQANLTGPGVTYENNEALWVERAGVLTLLAREGDEAPGFLGNVTYGGTSVLADFGSVALNALGQTAFIARVGGSNLPFAVPIFSDHAGPLSKLVMAGEPAPGTNQTFGFLADPVLSDGGRIAFRASLSNGGSWPPLGIWWDQPGAPGDLAPLVVPGQEMPGHPGMTIVGTNFIVGFNAAGQLAFTATIEDPDAGARTALLFAEPSGALSLVAAAGDLFDAGGSAGTGDLREVTAVALGDLNDAGQMAIRLDFADGSMGFYRVSSATVAVESAAHPGFLRLAQNLPNPFGGSTRIEFDLSRPARASLGVYDAAGRLVRRLLEEARPAGRHDIVWDGRGHDGRDVPSGIYWARLETDGASRSIRMVRLRQ